MVKTTNGTISIGVAADNVSQTKQKRDNPTEAATPEIKSSKQTVRAANKRTTLSKVDNERDKLFGITE